MKNQNDKSKSVWLLSYTEWEDQVTEALEHKLEVTRSDAQGIVEANNFKMIQAWGKALSVEATADLIIG